MAALKDGITLPASVLIALLSGAASLGGAAVGFFQSYSNAERAINVAVQHGKELEQIRAAMAQDRRDLYARTAERWTRTEHLRYAETVDREQRAQDRRLEAIEKTLTLERRD